MQLESGCLVKEQVIQTDFVSKQLTIRINPEQGVENNESVTWIKKDDVDSMVVVPLHERN